MTPRWYIGLDPGTHTGVAVWDGKMRRFLSISTRTATDARDFIARNFPPEETAIIFEDARQRKWLPREKNLSEYRGRLIGAGSIKRDCEIWVEFCDFYHYTYTAIPPRKGMTKWTEEQFTRITGWTTRTSNHARDAALLVFGK